MFVCEIEFISRLQRSVMSHQSGVIRYYIKQDDVTRAFYNKSSPPRNNVSSLLMEMCRQTNKKSPSDTTTSFIREQSPTSEHASVKHEEH